ncbi:MAG: ATP synthase F0 subunit C [Candidatus Omnitrophica bacterium]|nr:ATP synthase F0 subunit C [Candidatus Omnitrophota bacterium]
MPAAEQYKAWLAAAVPTMVAVTAFGSALALGRAVSSAMDATARQPEAAIKILINMMAGCVLIEALTIYSMIVAFTFGNKI